MPEVKNAWSYISTPQYIMERCLTEQDMRLHSVMLS